MYISSQCFMKTLHNQGLVAMLSQPWRGGRTYLLVSRYASASSSAFASCRSAVSKPSVNQP